jgi:hypothetical protein
MTASMLDKIHTKFKLELVPYLTQFCGSQQSFQCLSVKGAPCSVVLSGQSDMLSHHTSIGTSPPSKVTIVSDRDLRDWMDEFMLQSRIS